MTLNTQELATLKIIASNDRESDVPRVHLEKLSRLDLIEPCEQGVCLTTHGKQTLVKRK